VSIGNLSTGGTGKTPFTASLAALLTTAGRSPVILSRGYGRSSQHASCVDPLGTAAEFGDEPLLLARTAPVYVAADRYKAGLLAAQELPITPATVFLLDDGFQHRQLARNVDIVLLSRSDLSDSPLPSGNLREPLAALSRTHVLVLREEDAMLASEFFRRFTRPSCSRPVVWTVRRSLDLGALPADPGPCLAFAGIARPRDFFDGLRTCGLNMPATLAFPDHHDYSFADITRIIATLKAAKASLLLTTEKDMVRLRPQARAALEATAPLHAVPLQTELLNPEACLRQLDALCVRQS
jgi:tetraacyldisaccharide 4'-kinase